SHAVAYGNGLFVVPKIGGTVTSSDGIQWVEHQSSIDYVSGLAFGGLAFGNGRFVWVDSSGATFSSADGVNWVQRFSGLSNGYIITGVAYGNGRFVAVGNQPSRGESPRHVTVTSTDGTNWVLHPWQIHGVEYGGPAFSGIAYGNGQFVVVG